MVSMDNMLFYSALTADHENVLEQRQEVLVRRRGGQPMLQGLQHDLWIAYIDMSQTELLGKWLLIMATSGNKEVQMPAHNIEQTMKLTVSIFWERTQQISLCGTRAAKTTFRSTDKKMLE